MGNMSSKADFVAFRNAWDIHNKPIDEVGADMAEFALGSIAAMASKNPPQPLPGGLPRLGSQLNVTWGFAAYLLGCIAVVHCALSALAFYVNWRNNTYSLVGTGDGAIGDSTTEMV